MKVTLKKLGVPNKNGIIYSEDTMQEAIRKLEDKPILGIIGSEYSSTIDLAKAAFEISDICIENGSVMAKCKILKTPEGDNLMNIADDVEFRFSGTGEVDEFGNVSNFSISCVNAISKDSVA